ncbi:hypothetical protein WMY93_001753 [Mugilogobius chulae]|uniref:Fibronectin type-III domain-containing protein n=1 Tax=Mugilogobius chulae TaxID=88201 RepID=A0AAW0Q2I1_9GOBI
MLILLLLCWLPSVSPVKSVPAAPLRAVLKSSNMNHILQWDRGPDTAPDTAYSVSFHTDRSPCCDVVPGCERVVDPPVCDLTQEFSDPEETYHIRVTAGLEADSAQSSSPWITFHPLSDTELELPILRVTHCESSLCVDMSSPVPALHHIYDSFHYELQLQTDDQRPR